MWWSLATDWTSAVPLNAHIETMPSVMVFKSRACGKCSGHESGALMNEISALIKQTQQNSLASLPHWWHGEKALSMKQQVPSFIEWTLFWDQKWQCVSHNLQTSWHGCISDFNLTVSWTLTFSISTKVTRQEIQMSKSSDWCRGWLLTYLKYTFKLEFDALK